VQLLEKEIKKYAIPGPDKNRSDIKSGVEIEVLYDEVIAQEFFIFAQENVEQLLRILRTTTDSEPLRKLFMRFTFKAIKRADRVIHYLKLKGWLETPPLYQHIPPNVTDKLAAGEAFHLWDHLTYRYDNISQTEIYYAFAKDPEFKILLKTGLQSVLVKQAKVLEKELSHFGIPLPKQPKLFNLTSDSTEMMFDDHMFRMVLTGIQGAAIFHALALKQSTVNDRIRTLFKDLLFDELKINDEMIKFGKAKGWLHAVPQYRLA
jgi:hypothetical protein